MAGVAADGGTGGGLLRQEEVAKEVLFSYFKPMKKALFFLGIFLGIVIMLWVVGRTTNLIQTFTVVTKANEPSLPTGNTLVASSFKRPELFDFICYHTEDEFSGKYIATHRVCGMPGDLIQITNGDLFINGRAVDLNLKLRHVYKMHTKDYDEKLNVSERQISLEGDSVVVFLDDRQVTDGHLKATRKLLPASEPDQFIKRKFSADWNQDNFGPIKVPANSYFVLGDNRLESNDSRYLGFVPKDNLVATVIWSR